MELIEWYELWNVGPGMKIKEKRQLIFVCKGLCRLTRCVGSQTSCQHESLDEHMRGEWANLDSVLNGLGNLSRPFGQLLVHMRRTTMNLLGLPLHCTTRGYQSGREESTSGKRMGIFGKKWKRGKVMEQTGRR